MGVRMAKARKALSCSLIAISCLLLPRLVSAEQTPRPYAMHEIRLGSTLTQLRRLNFLNDEEQDRLRLVCSIDPEGAHVDVLDTIRIGRPGAVRCALFERGGDGLRPGKIRIFGELIQPTLLLYKREGDRDLRLAQIGTSLQADRFTQVVPLMRQTYGPPTNSEMSNIETSEGDIGNANWVWNNGISSIRADLLGLDLDHMSVTFTYDAFMADIETQERATTVP
jgi:hypothetical protein